MSKIKNLFAEKFTYDKINNVYSFMNILPNPDKILQRIGKTIEVYRDLKNDAHLWSCIQSRKSGTLSLDWKIEGNANNQEKIEEVFNKFDVVQIIRDILEAPLFGYQPMEIVWDNETRDILPTKVIAKPQEWFDFDRKGNLIFKGTNDVVDKYKILDVRYESSYLNPYGISLLSKCYWSITFKNGGLRFWVNFAEKYGMPILLGKYQRGATQDEIETLAEDLNNMTEDAVLVAPVDIDLEMHEASKSSSVELYKELIKHCNAEISKAILSQTLTTELDMGSYAAAQTHFKVRKEVILSDIRLVESTLNELIRYIYEVNNWDGKQPKFVINMQDDDLQSSE